MQPLLRRWRLDRPLDLARTLGPLRHGIGDPTTRLTDGVFWRASRTPDGPGTLALRRDGDELSARAWGPGAGWLLESVPGLVGESDDWSGLDVGSHPVLGEVRRRIPGLRLCRTGLVMEVLVPACLEQRVTGTEAWRAWRQLVRDHGESAPGPVEPGLRVAPDAVALRSVPSWDWHRYGVDSRRYLTIRAAAAVASRLEECAVLAAANRYHEARRRLRVVPGIGVWTAAETALRALGDPDSVSVGDFHLKHLVGYVLTGAPRSDDARMIELLEPWRGQRARVVRLIELTGLTPPRYGPRFSPNDIRMI